MTKINNDSQHHCEKTVFDHSILALIEADNMNCNNIVKFASLFHDIGKIDSYLNNGDFKLHFKKDTVLSSVFRLKKDLNLPNEYSNFLLSCSLFHHKIHLIKELKHSTILKMFNDKLFVKNKNDLNNLIQVCKNDELGRVYSIDTNYRSLSKQELEEVFKFGIKTIDNVVYKKDSVSLINEGYFQRLFSAYNEKVNVNDLLKESNNNRVDSKKIREFVYNIKLNRLKQVKA